MRTHLELGQLLNKTITTLKESGVDSARLDALIIFEHVLNLERTQILTHPEQFLSLDEVRLIGALSDRRLSGEPIAYIIGTRQFYGLTINVDNRVLVPRPETEQIVEHILSSNHTHPGTLIDVATGSGAIAIAIAKNSEYEVTATDISEDALVIAQSNIDKYGLSINLVQSNLLEKITEKFNVITANLPYLPYNENLPVTNSLSFEPKLALYSGKDGLDLYRRLFSNVDQYLKPKGMIVIEHLPGQFKKIQEITKSKFNAVSLSEHVTELTAK